MFIQPSYLLLTVPTSEWWARFAADVNQHSPINKFGKSHWPKLDWVVSGWWVCTSVFDWLFHDSILDVLFFQLFRAFKFFRHHWSTQWLSKVVCVPGETGSEGCEAIGLCNAGNLGDSSPWDTHFPSSKSSSLPDSKVVQILPLSAGVLHQNNVMGHNIDFQGRSSAMAKAGSTIPWNASVISPHCCLSWRSCTPSFSTCTKQTGVSLWVTREPRQELRTGTYLTKCRTICWGPLKSHQMMGIPEVCLPEVCSEVWSHSHAPDRGKMSASDLPRDV